MSTYEVVIPDLDRDSADLVRQELEAAGIRGEAIEVREVSR